MVWAWVLRSPSPPRPPPTFFLPPSLLLSTLPLCPSGVCVCVVYVSVWAREGVGVGGSVGIGVGVDNSGGWWVGVMSWVRGMVLMSVLVPMLVLVWVWVSTPCQSRPGRTNLKSLLTPNPTQNQTLRPFSTGASALYGGHHIPRLRQGASQRQARGQRSNPRRVRYLD